MIYLKTDDEIELLRKANLLVSATLTEIAKVVEPGGEPRAGIHPYLVHLFLLQSVLLSIML